MNVIDSKTITLAATFVEWIDAMEEAMSVSLSGEYIMPQRLHLDQGKNTFLVMPCIAGEYWVTKLVSFCPDNTVSGIPSIYGTIVLSRTGTGEPLAVMEGGDITALRTAAVSALGIKYLAPENATTLGIVGTGSQGIQQARFACTVRDIRQVTVFDRSERSISRFLDAFKADFPAIRVRVAKNAEQLCSETEIIITATNSNDPVFPDKSVLFEGKTFVGIGSYKPDCREYPDSFFRQIDQIFVDTIHGKKESGDLLYPIQNRLIPESNIYPLGSLIAGIVALSAKPTKFYKTVGSALFDLYAAKLIYEKMTGADHDPSCTI